MTVTSTVQKAAETGRTFVCPRCRRPFAELGAPAQCPEDGTYLVRQRDLAAAERDPMVGRSLEGRYTITARVGAGSMGTVYRAKQHAMGREVAIKILRGDRALDETAKARFLREARANSLLASANTVTVFDFGEAQSGELYLAMELLEGESVGQRLARQGRFRLEDAIETTRQALRSLGEAHAKGIVHRDLKPDNLFYSRVQASGRTEELVKVLDFGIAKMMREDAAHLNAIETQAGTVFGTPRYMSPEQAQGKPLDARSDLYSLGVILYQMLTGKPPFTDDDAIVVMARHIKTPPKPPTETCPEAGIPPELEKVVMRALAKDANDRPINADAFGAELARVLETGIPSTSGVRRSLAPADQAPIISVTLPPGFNATGSRGLSQAQLGSSHGPSNLLSNLPSPNAPTSEMALPVDHVGKRNVLIGVFLLALALVTAIVVFVGMSRPPPEPIASQRSPARPPASNVDPGVATDGTSDMVVPAPFPLAPSGPSGPLAPSTTNVGAAGSNATAPEPPAVSPDALPKARGNGPGGAGGSRQGRSGGRPRPSPSGASSSGNASGYGILD